MFHLFRFVHSKMEQVEQDGKNAQKLPVLHFNKHSRAMVFILTSVPDQTSLSRRCQPWSGSHCKAGQAVIMHF
jgi:hypothetical protein